MSQPVPNERIAQRAPAGPGRWLALALLSLAQFMLILDLTVINVALPQLGSELGLAGPSAGWAITAYAIPFGGLLLLGGRVSDLLGSRRAFRIGLVVFTVASLIAGLAIDAGTLFGARAGQGVGAALLSPAALATVVGRYTGADRHRALATWGAVGAVGAAVGVLVGGIITEGSGWRWIFFVNVPIGILVTVLIPLTVPAVRVVPNGRRIDLWGAALGTSGVGTLIYGITGIRGAANLGTSVALISTAGLLFLLFWLRQRTAPEPLLDLRVLSPRSMRAGILIMGAASALLVGSFFVLSFALQAHHRWSPLSTGVAFLPVALAVLAGAHLGGHLASRHGGRVVVVTALSLAGLGAAWAALNIESIAALLLGVAGSALGLGAAFVVATSTAMADVDAPVMGAASGVVNTFHELGGAVGVALLSTVGASSFTAPQVTSGFTAAYLTAAALAIGAALAATLLVPSRMPSTVAVHLMH